MRCAIVLTALAGCASVGEPPGLSAPGMSVDDTSGVRVIGPTYEMDFSAIGLHLPSHLTVNGGMSELLGSDEPCFENGVGFTVIPALSVAAGVHGKASRSEITTVLAGPAVVKIHVAFAVDYDCPGPQTLSGATDFTLFPTARIVREDTMVAPSTDRLGVVGQCGCQQETDPQNFHNLFFDTFWAFDPAQATQVQADGSPVTEDVFAACTMYPDRAIGVAWDMQAGTGTRFHANAGATHILDWVTDQSSLDATPHSITSAIQIANAPPAGLADCGPVLALLADVPLQTGATLLDATGHDGIYRDPVAHSAAFTITAHGAEVPAGFVVSVDLGGASHAALTRSPASDQIGVVQRETDTRFLIAFTDGLGAGESVTIEPRR